MIKKTRNAFLAIAVASVGFGCAGGEIDPEDPLDLTNNPNAIDGITDAAPETFLAIGQLLSSTFAGLIGQTSSVFGTLNAVTDPNTGVGSYLASQGTGVQSAQASGVTIGGNANIANCSRGGTFFLFADLTSIPDFAAGLAFLSDGDFDLSLSSEYVQCNEPLHLSYNAGSVPVQETDGQGAVINNLINGAFALSLRSKADLNTDDFSLNASIEMKDYFIQRYSVGSDAVPPDVLNGSIDLSLNAFGTNYFITMSTDIINNNSSEGEGYVSSALLLDGQIEVSSTFAIGAYNLSIEGRLRNYAVTGSDSSFQVYTVENLVRNSTDTAPGSVAGVLGVPSEGVLALMTVSNTGQTQTSTATVTATGLDIVAVVDGQVSMYSCTWDQVNGVNGATCGG